MNPQKVFSFPMITAALLLLVCSCNSSDTKKEDSTDLLKEASTQDAGETKVVKVDKAIFSIPSPVQISMLIRQSGANYSKGMLNKPSSSTNYATNYSRAMNIGIYGADLGYCSIYEQSQDAIGYLNTLKQMADGLGISEGFDQNLFNRFKNNLGKKDSVMGIITEAFRNSDAYLKNNSRNKIGAIILAGGWIESLYLLTHVAQTNAKSEIMERIGEQSGTLENLIKMLEPYQDQKEINMLVSDLNELQNIFENVRVSYTYHESTHHASEKMTNINSESKAEISMEQLKQLATGIENIRTDIVK